jgi:hypothetical protein
MKRILLLGILAFATACPAVSSDTKDTEVIAERNTSNLVQIILEEYKAVRAEIILCLEERVTIVSFGFAAIGALLAGGVAALSRGKENWFLAALVFGLVTLTSLYVFNVWIVASQRLARASYHNYALEMKINNLYPKDVPPLEWEHNVRETTGNYVRFLPSDKGAPWIFLIISFISTVVGSGLFWRGTKNLPRLRRWRFAVFLLAVLLSSWGVYKGKAALKNLDALYQLVPS